MRSLLPVLALLGALLPLSVAPTAAGAVSNRNGTQAATETFAYDATSGFAEQDQLVAQLADATHHGRALRLPRGSLSLTRTLWMPAGAKLLLDAGATVTGSIAGQSLVRLQTGSQLMGGTVWNRSTSDCFDVDVANQTSNAVVDDVTFRGARTNALYVNAPGVRNLTVRNSRFVDTVYGVLVNPGAVRSRGIRIEGNSFIRTTGDAVEFNVPVTAEADSVRDVAVSRNTVRDMRGAGPGSGFAIGIAGVRDFTITGNRLLGVRNEGVHLEAGVSGGVVDGNLIIGGGTGGRPAVAVYRTVDNVVIRRNVLDRFRGSGIAVLWDAVGSSTRITVSQNLIRRVTADGIVMGGNAGTGPFVTRRNVVIGARNGIVTLGVHTQDTVADNLVRDVLGKSVLSAYQGTSRRTVTGNTSTLTTSIRSVVGGVVVALARSGYPKPPAGKSPSLAR